MALVELGSDTYSEVRLLSIVQHVYGDVEESDLQNEARMEQAERLGCEIQDDSALPRVSQPQMY